LGLPNSGIAEAPKPLVRRVEEQPPQLATHDYIGDEPLYACIETGSELLTAIRGYYKHGVFSEQKENAAAQTYGWPIQGWCVSSEVATKLQSTSWLTEHVALTFEHIADVHDDDALSNIDADELIDEWILSVSSAGCADVCSAANALPPPSVMTSSNSWNDENVTSFDANYDTEWEEEEEALLGESESEVSAAEKDVKNDDTELEEEQEAQPWDITSEFDGKEEDLSNYDNEWGGEEEDEILLGDIESEVYAEEDDAQVYDMETDTSTYSPESEEEEEGDEAYLGNIESEFFVDDQDTASYNTEWGEDENESEAIFADSSSESYADATNEIKNHESTKSGSRNKTTTGMLIRLIPVKLVALLSFMCLVLGVRQMFMSPDGDSRCCCKLGCSFFGFGSGGHASYQGIDPSDVSDHQKVVDLELLQLSASGDMESEFDVVIS